MEDMDKAGASTTAQLLQQKGLEHEAGYLQQLKDEGKSVVEIPKDRNLQDRPQLTLERSGDAKMDTVLNNEFRIL